MFLKELIRPNSAQKFRSSRWPKEPFVSRGPVTRFGSLSSIPELQSVAALLSNATEMIAVFGEGRSGHEQPSKCLRLYERGYTLYFTRIEKWVPKLLPLVRTLEKDLGLHRGEIYCEAFASLKGSGMRQHFDFEHNFNIQLRGKKRWKLARNQHVENPGMSWHAPSPVPPALVAYSKLPFPSRMPRGSKSFEASPGTCVFLPRGCWHATESKSESFAVVFVVAPKTWSTLLLGELEKKLSLRPEWREFAIKRSKAPLVSKLEKLAVAVQKLDADQLLREWDDLHERSYKLDPRVSKALRAQLKNKRAPERAALARWILSKKGWFSADELSASLPSMPEFQIRRTLRTWAEAGFLRSARQ